MTAQAPPKPPSEPPDEKFWQRYSPRSELPLSSVASVSLHLLILVVLLAGGVLFVQSQEKAKPLPAMAVEIGKDQDSGNGAVAGEQPPVAKPEAIEQVPSPAPDRRAAAKPGGSLRLSIASAHEPRPQFGDPSQEIITGAKDAESNLSNIIGAIQKEQARPPGPGRTGDGAKRIRGGKLDPDRVARMDRWVLKIETRDGGNDYVRQLRALGAILAIPQPDGQYLVIRDLTKRPARGRIEDIAGIQRIFWVDNKPESVRSLAAALQLERVPPWFATFFPEDLERELLRKELAFKNRREADIQKTYFCLERKGTSYEPVVVAQEPREGVK